MSDNEIISQLRNLRKFQRDQLYSRLYPAYVENRKDVLKEVSERLVLEEEEQVKLYSEWSHLQYKWFSDSAKEESASAYRIAKKKFETTTRERENIVTTYENTCEFNTKLKEFDIETERMILAHICNVELICGQKMLVSDSTE